MEKKSADLYEGLIGKIAVGDKNALSTLYGLSKSSVYGFALSIVRNIQDAEDVLQDTFVSIFLSARHYKNMGKPMAWILTIAKNTALMKIRGAAKTTPIPEGAGGIFAADDITGNIISKRITEAALKELSHEESQIVVLHAVAGFKHRETAEILELPLSTVLSKYNRAVKKLKTILKEERRLK